MRCMICEVLSTSHICHACQDEHLFPSLYTRFIQKIPVYSFYQYSEIEPFLLTKHKDIGFYIYSILAENSFKRFSQKFEYNERVASLSIDDHNRSGYSHTAILNRSLRSDKIHDQYGKLRAQSHYSYSGKDYQFRIEHPRKFIFKEISEKYVILVDDIITTGSTLSQAINLLKSQGKEVIFCLTLANAEKN